MVRRSQKDSDDGASSCVLKHVEQCGAAMRVSVRGARNSRRLLPLLGGEGRGEGEPENQFASTANSYRPRVGFVKRDLLQGSQLSHFCVRNV